MVKVEFLGPIGRDPIELDISNLQELSVELNKDEAMKEWLRHCAVAVNDTMVADVDYKLNHGDNITLLPPVCGG